MIPHLTIVVPSLNEEPYIIACLNSLLAQAELLGAEIIVADGGSTDQTRPLVHRLAADHSMLRLIDNPARTQSAAVNLVAVTSTAAMLIRADAHAAYPSDFVATCLKAMTVNGATSVVVPMITAGRGGFQNAVAAAQNSRLGNGGSPHRASPQSGFVAHGHHAAFDRAFFVAVGGYDESFTHNEDAEFDQRALRKGGRIWMCADTAVTYFPRADPVSLARQYICHGRGRASMLRKHHLRPRLRQIAPVFALLGVMLALVGAPWQPMLLLLPLAYASLCLVIGAAIGVRSRDPWQALSGVAAIIMHLSWGWGFLAGARSWRPPMQPGASPMPVSS